MSTTGGRFGLESTDCGAALAKKGVPHGESKWPAICVSFVGGLVLPDCFE